MRREYDGVYSQVIIMLINSSKWESFSHSLLGGILYGLWIWAHQWYYEQHIHQILESAWGQFATTLVNGFINLQLYNFTKQKLSKMGFNDIYSKVWGWLVSGTETFLLIWFVQNFLWTKNTLSIALLYAGMSGLLIPTIYEKILKSTKLSQSQEK